MSRALVALTLLSWPLGAWGAGAAPSVVAAQVAVPRAPSSEVVTDLNRHLRRVLMSQPAVLTPTPSVWEAAIAQHKRQDCDLNDDCLQQLAVLAGTLYAIFTSVELDLTRTKVVAIGRIVRRDGVLVAVDAEYGFSAEVATGARAFDVVAREALAALIAKMQLPALPPTLPATRAASLHRVDKAPELAGPGPGPAPVAAATARSAGGFAGKLILGFGAALLASGIIAFAIGEGQLGSLTPVDGNLPAEQLGAYRSGTMLRALGLAVGGLGMVTAITGLVLWLTGDSVGARTSLLPAGGQPVVARWW